MSIPFVGQRMTRDEFAAYLLKLSFTTFKPEFVTLHHTAAPSLAQRPHGLSAQHLQNLRSYYEVTMGWNGAPHVFIDDQEDGIIVFQKMNARGVHAVSFNRNSWGVEMLGYYDVEPFDAGRGAAVRNNAMHALAIMCERLDVRADTIKFHRDDPKTNKTCPGMKVSKSFVIPAVQKLMNDGDVHDQVPDYSEWTVIMPNGNVWENTRVANARVIIRARDFLLALNPKSNIAIAGAKVSWEQNGTGSLIPVTEVDEDNRSWLSVRDVATAAKLEIKVDGNKIILS